MAADRMINYLRISITDRCNLRCLYCMAEEGVPVQDHRQILTYEEILTVARTAVGLGVDRFRVTGGEPLVRKGVVDFVGRLAALEGVREVALTTNGLLLPALAGPLRAAGLARLNVSLDSLRPRTYRRVTRGGSLEAALRGLATALAEGFSPVKVNVVLLGGLNGGEVETFAALAGAYPLVVRFIELMPLGESHRWPRYRFLPGPAVMARLAQGGRLEPVAGIPGNGPAAYYRWSPHRPAEPPRLPGVEATGNGVATLGMISPLSRPFCSGCNRLRLTADGKLHACLATEAGVDLRRALREGAGERDLGELIRQAAAMKPEIHSLGSGCGRRRRMSELGG
ncbi:MAG: GTP 3',8-cyclase MoaA [bacterium]|nr:GTP 3',8-cyclase MoaA [bacterium]